LSNEGCVAKTDSGLVEEAFVLTARAERDSGKLQADLY
jgi:hypothetical protein